jgi:hypothetical protein
MEHQINHSKVYHSLTAGRQGFVVLTQPSILAQPTKGTFHYPASGQYHETMQVTTLDNLNNPSECASGPTHKCTGITSIHPYSFQPPKSVSKFFQNQTTTITILNVGCVYYHNQNQAEGINEQVPLTPRNLLSSVITAAPPFSAVFTLWLSIIPALGVGLCPAWRRTCSRRRS